MINADRRRCPRSRVGFAALLAVTLVAAGCRLSEEQAAAPPAPSPTSASVPGEPGVVSAAVPIEGYLALDARQLEAERLDEAWRADAERDRLMRQGIATPGATPAPTGAAPLGTPSPASAASAPVERLRALIASAGGATAAATPAPSSRATPQPSPAAKGKASTGTETWEQISPDAFATFEPRFPIARDGGGPTVLAVQQLLDRVRFSPGAVDGRWGKNTEKAVYWLQAALGLESTGTVDADLFARLREAAGTTSAVKQYTLTAADVAGPFTEIPDDYVKQADLDCLCYRSAAESLAERFHMTGDLLKKLNPDADLEHLAAGTELWVLDVEPFDAATARGGGAAGEAPIAELVISKDGFYLQALDANRQVLYHFPTTVGAGYDASPSGDLTVTATSYNPTFHYQPKLFADVDDSKPEANLPAGPNSPVGVVWMQLSKENFGIHGTAEPANIGYRTSHGCVRLTNWDALFLAQRVGRGTPVHFRGLDPAASPAR